MVESLFILKSAHNWIESHLQKFRTWIYTGCGRRKVEYWGNFKHVTWVELFVQKCYKLLHVGYQEIKRKQKSARKSCLIRTQILIVLTLCNPQRLCCWNAYIWKPVWLKFVVTCLLLHWIIWVHYHTATKEKLCETRISWKDTQL